VRGPLVEATDRAVLIRVPMVGRFLVTAAGPVLAEREAGATDSDLRCFLDEPVAAAAALLRGDLVLHAAAVAIGGRAVVLCGPPAVGKSALAAALAQRGHSVLADAVTAVAPVPDGDPLVVAPLAPEPVLWPDMVEELGLRDQPARAVRHALSKRAYRIGATATAAPLAAIVDLHARVTAGAPVVERMTGAEALTTLLGVRWHARLVAPLGREAAQFQVAARAAADATHVRLLRPRLGTPTAELAELVEAVAV
jgi:serine kinase of HPr protein (carbohydrate metabolism regulator)